MSRIALRTELTAIKRQRIVSAAAKLFYQNGYELTTLEAVATELQTTKQFLYTYFDGKAQILFEVCKIANLLGLEAAREAANAQGKAVERLHWFMSEFTRMICRNRLSVAVFVREEKNLQSEHYAELRNNRSQFDASLAKLLEEGKRAGEFDVKDVQLATRLMAGMGTFIYSWPRADGEQEVEKLAKLVADHAVRMVVMPAPRSG